MMHVAGPVWVLLDILLTGTGAVSGSAKYTWIEPVQPVVYPVSGYGPNAIGMGGIVGDLELESNTLTIGGEAVVLPDTAAATLSYNGVGIVEENGEIYPVAETFSSASISVYDPESGGGGPEIPEPGSFLLLVMGALGLVAIRRRG